MRFTLFSWLFLLPFWLILSASVNFGLVSGQCLEDQRLLLVRLKDGLKFNSNISTRLVKWNTNEDCCRWDGVGCDTSGRVISLELDGESISSGIENSTSLFSFQYLQKLNLAFNSFSSIPIPSGMSNLKNLVHLNLSAAGFEGQIPIELSSLRKLVSLDLSIQFPGVQPLKLENPNLKKLVQNLSNLEELYLDGVDISAQRREWCWALASSLPRLKVLSLKNCKISGPVDASLSELLSLSVIQLDRNNLSTTVPDVLGNIPNLRTLSLSSCNLQGTFPQKIFEVQTLQILDLSNNNFLQGNLQEFPQNGSLRTLALSYTNFSGSIPSSISNLRNLSRIELSNCNFSGPIPPAMANLTELVYFDFSSNNFTGQIPSFQKSKNLSYVDLSRNSLTGSLSHTQFGGLLNLVNLNLGSNSLTGSIPSSVFALASLRKLQLSNNQLSGNIEEFVNASFSLLDTLDLSANRLNGSIPKFFFSLKTLNVLSLSSNSFTGTIQLETIKNLGNLARLELSYNNISVDPRSNNSPTSHLPQLNVLKLASCKMHTFPDLTNQSRMVTLDLSDNQIKGEIPKWIWEVGDGNLMNVNLSSNLLVGLQKPYSFPNLISLDLHSNQLQGEIPIPPATAIYVDYSSNNFSNPIPPDIVNNMSFANFFSLSNNSLTGSIPESLCNATYLFVLDFSDNSLDGNIPPCLVENFGPLGVLNLARNKLTGSIPDTFQVSSRLKTLDLSSNALEGNIPGSLINCTVLEVLNIGNNKIEDTFPCMLKNSSSLRVLVLRSNKLHGDIICPGANNSWPEVQIIDIAINNFNGTLSPECFSNWRSMMLDDNDTQVKGDHLRFGFLYLNQFYYQDKVTVTIKGLELELVKILTVFTSIDFSNNEFTGEIPDIIGDLRSLYILNLSNNAFTGRIPSSIGKLASLGSLDLSVNELTGEIPETLANLNFLSFLNLSFNKLFGKIPTGTQLQSFNATSYQENAGLCGSPLTKSCDSSKSPSSESISTSEIDWGSIFTGLGLGVGAAIIFVHLVFCEKVSHWFDERLYKIFLLLFPSYRFTYIRYDEGNVQVEESFEDKSLEDSEYFDEYEISDTSMQGRYCVLCTKLDGHRKKAVHNLNCTCHDSPPNYSYSHSSASSCSLLVVYR